MWWRLTPRVRLPLVACSRASDNRTAARGNHRNLRILAFVVLGVPPPLRGSLLLQQKMNVRSLVDSTTGDLVRALPPSPSLSQSPRTDPLCLRPAYPDPCAVMGGRFTGRPFYAEDKRLDRSSVVYWADSPLVNRRKPRLAGGRRPRSARRPRRASTRARARGHLRR